MGRTIYIQHDIVPRDSDTLIGIMDTPREVRTDGPLPNVDQRIEIGGAMSEVTKIKGGISIENFWEREAGGAHHKVILLGDLASAVYGARLEWEYDTESPEAVELVRLCGELERFLTDLSILPDGDLTLYRECARCSGAGGFPDELVCAECGGAGAVHASEADG